MKFLFALFITITAYAHCPIYFETENLCADLKWKDGPYLNVENSFELKFWEKGDHNHTTVSPNKDVSFLSWMVMDNGHSHGGPALKWEETDAGVFNVTNAKFFMHGMKGYWSVRIQLKEADVVAEEFFYTIEFKK